MTGTANQKTSAAYLRTAQTLLICRVESDSGWRVDSEGGLRCKLTPYISEVERGWADPRHSIRRPRAFRTVVGPPRRLPRELLVCLWRRRRSFLDSRAGSVGSSAMACSGPYCGPGPRHGNGGAPRDGRRTFSFRCDLRRRFHLSHHLGRIRLHLSLAAHPPVR
jgi:hypothetical protein